MYKRDGGDEKEKKFLDTPKAFLSIHKVRLIQISNQRKTFR